MDQEAAVPAVNAYAEAIAQYHLLWGTQQQTCRMLLQWLTDRQMDAS